MKANRLITKGVAGLLSAALVLGFDTAGGGIKTYAAGNTEEPSLQAYASKDDLMKRFNPGSNGTSDTVGKIYFGKNGSVPQQWYILGRDSQVADGNGDTDNIAIFATNNITAMNFHNSTGSHKYEGDDDEEYVSEGTTEQEDVAANHYGESVIRAELRKMSGEEGEDTYQYFTDTEKDMMQKTKVLSHEWNKETNLYTTNDKLYLASAKYDDENKYIYVGGVNTTGKGYPKLDDEYTSKKLANKTYWSQESWFWLRSPYPDYDISVLSAYPGSGGIYDYSVDNPFYGVRPASNLNLSSVIFASAADAASSDDPHGGTIKTSGTDQAAMILRLDGKGKNIGTFTYNDSDITVKRGSTTKDVYLVVQGKTAGTEGEDWYYSKLITNTDDVNVTLDMIASAVNTSAGASTISTDDIKFTDTNCKIWLEIPESDATKLRYAVDTPHTHTWSDKLTPYDGTQHGYACTDPECPDKGKAAGFNDLSDHTYDDADICTECGYSKGGHIVTKVERKEPTSTSVGYKAHYECSHCDKWFIYPAVIGGLIEKPKSYFEIPATGQRKSARNSDRYKTDTSSTATSSTATSNGGATSWFMDASGRWWFYNGNTKVTGWAYDNAAHKWYYIDENTGMHYGWFYDTTDGYWYYLDATTGEMLTGWQLINGKQYYFAPAPEAATYTFDAASSKWVYNNAANNRPYGSMYSNAVTPDNHQVDADGARIQ